MFATIFWFTIGLALLVGGAQALVRGASQLAAAAGISPLVVGLTVVAFGTSAPEMAVSAGAALLGSAGADLALGNVVGSNIFNVLVVLGISAMAAPLAVEQKLVRWDVPLMIALSLLVWWLARDGAIGRAEGVFLFGGILLYTGFAVRQGRRESREVREEYSQEFGPVPGRRLRQMVNVLLVLAGLAALVLGARWLVAGSLAIARALGVNELIVSLTIVAGGTSLPELATSLVATLRGERDIAVGNVVGSNVFNLLAVLGMAAALGAGGIRVSAAALALDLPLMVAVAVVCLPIFFTGSRISRAEGLLFLFYYACYLAYLGLRATAPERLSELGSPVLFFVIPLTLLILLIEVVRELRSRRKAER